MIANERRTGDRARTSQDVQHARGQTGFGEALGNVEAGAWSVESQLEHDGVAVRKRRRRLPDRDRGGEVPRSDQAGDAHRAADGVDRIARRRLLVELADRPLALAGEELEDRHAAGHLAA